MGCQLLRPHVSDPQLAMARDVIDRLDLQGDERVLDAGCGTGRVTEVLARARPRRHGDRRRRQRGDGRGDPRKRGITAFTADLAELELDEPVDAILARRPSTGSPTTSACSPACTPRCARAAGSPPSAAARATSPTSRRRSTPSTIPPSAAGPDRGTSRRPRRRRSACEHAGFTDVWAWLQPWPVEPPDPKRVLHDRDPRLAPRAPARGGPRAVRGRRPRARHARANYVRLNILAREHLDLHADAARGPRMKGCAA